MQANKIDNYVMPLQTDGATGGAGLQAPNGEQEAPTLAELMAAIKGSWDLTIAKIDTVALEMGLLHADVPKISDRATATEGDVQTIQTELASLKRMVTELRTKTT